MEAPPKFHAGSKLAFIEQAASDRDLSDFDVRVTIAISRRLDGHGVALVSQNSIANFIGGTDRGVRKAIKALVRCGHIQIEGTARGRGSAETYRPLVKRRNGGSAIEAERRNGGSGNSEAGNPEQRSTKGGTVVPPLPYKNPIKNPGARARAGGEGSYGGWDGPRERLCKLLTPEVVDSWFKKVAYDGSKDGIVTLSAPTKFLRDWIENNYSAALSEVWKAADPSVRSVRIIVRTHALPDQPAKIGTAEEPISPPTLRVVGGTGGKERLREYVRQKTAGLAG
jgi:hypothetical protein